MSDQYDFRALAAEFFGTAFLLVTVVGSGIMAEQLAGGNVAIALLGNTIPTGAILYVLITIFGPVSGAHFNPAVTLVFLLKRENSERRATAFIAVQCVAGVLGVWVAHAMFDIDIVQFSQKARTGSPQWFAEFIATFGLLLTILGSVRFRPDSVAMAVGLYITAAYWFTASTSFANPAVTLARSFSNTFAGIAPGHVLAFVLAQLSGALCAWAVSRWLFSENEISN